MVQYITVENPERPGTATAAGLGGATTDPAEEQREVCHINRLANPPQRQYAQTTPGINRHSVGRITQWLGIMYLWDRNILFFTQFSK